MREAANKGVKSRADGSLPRLQSLHQHNRWTTLAIWCLCWFEEDCTQTALVFDALFHSFETKTGLSIEKIPHGGTRVIWRLSVRSPTPLVAMITKSKVQ